MLSDLESSTKIIIFKLILVRFKQNLKSSVRIFIFGGKIKKIIYIKKKGQFRGSFEPPALVIAPPIYI